jgi:hypothetical protein
MSTVDIEIVEVFESLGMDQTRALKAAAAFNRSGDSRMARVETDIGELRTDMKIMRDDVKHLSIRVEVHTWMLGIISAGIATLIIKSFFH